MVQLKAGVRQGGVLSPYLFAIFVDDLLIKLQHSSLGCHISRNCLNAIMYADDLLLMSISVNDLQLMVDLCIEEFENLDMLINVKKSVCMRIGHRHTAIVSNIVIQNQSMDWKCELRYLGVHFVSGNVLKCNLQVIRQKYFRALNGIFAKIGTRSSPMITLSLIDSFCIPLLSYGIEAFKVKQSTYNSLESAYTAAFAKKFSSYDKFVIRNCQFFCGVLPMCYRIDIKQLQFYANLNKTSNESVHALFIKFGKREFSELLLKYKLSATDSAFAWKNNVWKLFSNSCLD